MKIQMQILEEAARFSAFYGSRPEHVFIGRSQAAEIDQMVAEMVKLGLMVQGAPQPRAKFSGMEIYRVDAESHLSFGYAQPSPCG